MPHISIIGNYFLSHFIAYHCYSHIHISSTQSSLNSSFTPINSTFAGKRIFGKLHQQSKLGMVKDIITFHFKTYHKYSIKYSKLVFDHASHVLGRPSSDKFEHLVHDTLSENIPGSVALPFGAPCFDPACTRDSFRGYSRNYLLCVGSQCRSSLRGQSVPSLARMSSRSDLPFFSSTLFQTSPDYQCKVVERMTSSKKLGKIFIHNHYALSNISIVTYNVDTLFEAKSSAKNSKAFDRRTLLSEEFSALGWNIVFLQETRSSKGTSYTDHYVCISSGCSNGNYGVETWISKVLPVCHDGTVSQLRVSSRNVVDFFL